MKNLFLLFALFVTNYLTAQTQWTYTTNPVLAMDTSKWEAYGQPACIFHGDTLRMYYGAASFMGGDTVPRGRIHYAWSIDGVNWTKYSGNPVLDVGASGQWDDEWLDTPEILWDGNEFKLYYYGDSVYMTGAVNASLGLATSQDGINWTKKGIVLQKGNPGDWDGKFIESPAAYYDTSSGVYALWYSAQDTTGWIKIGLAVSADGTTWIKDTANPCLSNGAFNSWDDMFVAVPSVIRSGNIFEMWYSAVKWAVQYDSIRVGYAVSLNGRDWIKYLGNPVLDAFPGDSSEFWAVDVVWDSLNNKYMMWYENKNTTGTPAIYYATSPRNILFSPSCSTSASNDTLIMQGDTISLFASGGSGYQWYPADGLSNPGIANPLAWPTTSTQYTVLIVSDSCVNTEMVNVNVNPLGINSPDVAYMINVFPNPFRETATIMIYGQNPKNISLKVYDIVGREVRMNFIRQTDGLIISREGLKDGIYFLNIVSENGNKYSKVQVMSN